ncbi:MarR family winged helix-turn-helix transcriptional regulator [Dysgonomonas termitidis]
MLYSLSDKKSSCASDLSNQLGLSNSRTSKILLSLEEKKYITRRMGKVDKRNMLFSLTAKGKEKMKKIQARENIYIELISRLIKLIKQFIKQ